MDTLPIRGEDQTALLGSLLGAMDSRYHYRAFLEQAGPLLRMLAASTNDPVHARRVGDVLAYIREARGDPAELAGVAADLAAAGKALGEAHDRDSLFRAQHQSLQGDPPRLAGQDAWEARLVDQAGRWRDMAATHVDFAKLLQAALPDQTSDGLRVLLAEQPRQWFQELARLRGADSHDKQLALFKGLLAQVGSLSSEQTFKELFRGIREATVDAAQRQPMKVQAVDRRLAAVGEQLKSRTKKDRDRLQTHVDELADQDRRYRRMIELAERLNVQGRRQGLGDELGASRKQIDAWKARRTEVLGEIALTETMLARDQGAWELALHFAKGSGFDQVWVRRNADGRVEEYLIGEAKGPGAELGTTRFKGEQMSRQWVEDTIYEMVHRGELALAYDLYRALVSGTPIRGMIVQATEQGAAEMQDYRYRQGYGFAEDKKLKASIDDYLKNKARGPEPGSFFVKVPIATQPEGPEPDRVAGPAYVELEIRVGAEPESQGETEE